MSAGTAPPKPLDLSAVERALSIHGLSLRGAFDFDVGEDRPAGPSGTAARSVLLVGSGGSEWWRHFRRWRTGQPVDLADPLDTWSRQTLGPVADAAGARLVMPNDRPYAPFQRWAMRAERLRRSPLGLLMHPEYGLWHAYRGALLFDAPLPPELIQVARDPIHLCDLCDGKPCLKACPVDAYSLEEFAQERCLAHVRGAAGGPCRSGCLDRNACPHGPGWRYPAEAQAFLQKAFARLP